MDNVNVTDRLRRVAGIRNVLMVQVSRVQSGVILLSCLLAAGNLRGADLWNAGPLFDHFPLTLAPGDRTEAVGPLFYHELRDGQEMWATPPLLSHTADPLTDFEEFDFLYPLLTYDRFGTEYRWQLIQLLSFSGGQNQEEETTRRFTLFPFYFQQRSEDPERNYTALFPLYGHLRNRVLRDEIFFVMFPIFGRTRRGDMVTDNYLYPIFHLRRGNELHGWQVWPLIGREHKGITSRTNDWGETTVIGGHQKLFVLWPFFFNHHTGIGTENPQKQQALLPIYSILRSPQRDSTTVGWPFFTHVSDRGRRYTEWQTPWPFIVFARGEGKTTSRIWPLFSQAQTTNLQSAFYLWPVYKYNRVHGDALDRERTRILLFLYSDTIQKNTETGEARRRIDFWPLFTHGRNYDGSTRLQVLAPIEPMLPNNKSIERNYSPLWSIWRAERDPGSATASQSLLWNLYRRETGPEWRKCSLLFGLFQYQSGSQGKRLRLFYVPVLNTQGGAESD